MAVILGRGGRVHGDLGGRGKEVDGVHGDLGGRRGASGAHGDLGRWKGMGGVFGGCKGVTVIFGGWRVFQVCVCTFTLCWCANTCTIWVEAGDILKRGVEGIG